MKIFPGSNQSVVTASIFGVIGFALMLSVIVFHAHINDQPTLAQVETEIEILSTTEPRPVPDEVIQSIISDPRNLANLQTAQPAAPLPPAMQFLHDLSAQDLFITQD